MKTILSLIFLLVAFNISTVAQQSDKRYRLFKGELSFGYARFSSESDYKSGIGLTLEPKFLILDQLAIGPRFETMFQGRSTTSVYGDKDFDLKTSQSVLAIAEYYFTKDYKFRPFAGGGGGVYFISDATPVLNNNIYYEDSDNGTFKFGGMLRAGFEIKHFRFGLEYNFVPTTTITAYNVNGDLYDRESLNSYFSIKAGFCFGGGLKNR